MATLDLKFEAMPHITSRVNHNAAIRVGARAYPVRPMIFEGMATEDQQLDQESLGGGGGAEGMLRRLSREEWMAL